MKRFVYRTNCVDWGNESQNAGREIQDLIDGSRQITRRTFLKHVELGRVPEKLGYVKHPSQGLTMAGDWHISYHKGEWFGLPAYYFVWSAIEYIFVPRKENAHEQR
jgi:hypothetical protein